MRPIVTPWPSGYWRWAARWTEGALSFPSDGHAAPFAGAMLISTQQFITFGGGVGCRKCRQYRCGKENKRDCVMSHARDRKLSAHAASLQSRFRAANTTASRVRTQITQQAKDSNATWVLIVRSKRTCNLPKAASHACVRSTTQRWRPSLSLRSIPLRAIRFWTPRRLRCARQRAKS
jgi:hypothetical protein